jgi:ABC-type Fe3+-hydroxamate transport system substrate-binding protein
MTLDAEDVRSLNPDAILLIQPRAADDPPLGNPADPTLLRERLGPLANLNIAAVRSGRVALIDDPRALLPSTSLIQIAQHMRDALVRWSARPSQNVR